MQPADKHSKPNQLGQPCSIFGRMTGWGTIFGLAGMAFNASAQVPGTSAAGSVTAGNAVEVGAAAASGELKTSQVISDPGAPYNNLFQNFGVGLSGKPHIAGASAYFNVGPVNLGPYTSIPIRRGSRPENAEVKIGDFYVDINYLSASLLYSDNVNLTENNRRDKFGGAVTLGVTGLYQLNDGLQAAVSGAFIWLPFENKAGVAGFGLVDPFAMLALDSQALFNAGVNYNLTLAGWDILAYDDFRIINRTLYSLGDQGDIDFYSGETFDGRSDFRKQRIYTVPNSGGRPSSKRTQSTGSFDASELTYINTAGVTLTRVLPSELNTSVGYWHKNYWYSGSQSSLNGALPNTQDLFFAGVESIRENLRFKPYVYYSARTSDTQAGWDQFVIGGVRGPVTDYINFDGGAGYVFSGNTPSTSLIWQVALEHEINPTTSHRIRYFRLLTDPDRQLKETLEYQLRKVLGPHLTSGAFARRNVYSDLNTDQTLSTEDQLGAFLNYDLAEHGKLSFQGFYSRYDFTAPAVNDYDLWTFRAIYSRQITATIYGDFIYQFEKRDSVGVNDSYYENLIALRLTKLF